MDNAILFDLAPALVLEALLFRVRKLAVTAMEYHVTSRTWCEGGVHHRCLYTTPVARGAVRLGLNSIPRQSIRRNTLYVLELVIQRLLPQFPGPRLRRLFLFDCVDLA